MKLKNWVIWLLLVTFFASEVLLFSALRQKTAAQISLQSEKSRAEQLQAELDQLKSSNVAAQNGELVRLRADNQDLPRLRNEVMQLQAANQKLSQKLQAITTYARQQQAQVQQLTTAQQAQAEATERNTCINHLRQIDAAKQQWALEKNKGLSAVPTFADIAPYIKLDADGNIPGCPSGGTYTLNAVGELPSCSVPGHVLP